jgi:hypothetical protein
MPVTFRFLWTLSRKHTEARVERLWQLSDDVTGIYDMHVEFLESLLDHVRHCTNYDLKAFPRFMGTKSQFTSCLEQVKDRIWANEQGQMDAWQQLNMLYVVKKYFESFWTILTP